MYLRQDLPQPIPPRLSKLPIQNGYPVPWFIAEVDGRYDFRCIDYRKFNPAIKQRRCWICGEKLGSYLAFPIGPMCAINKTISEPPSHRECVEWSIKACPFLVQRQEVRRETNLPEGYTEPAGIAIARQPGVICMWITNKYDIWMIDGKPLFKLGDPIEVLWFREGRSATREEVLESINSGYPILYKAAELEGEGAIRQLEEYRQTAMALIPP